MYDGAECEGFDVEDDFCATENCPVDGMWTEWEGAMPCTEICGTGTTSYSRTCTAPAPAYGGMDCVGTSLDPNALCNTQVCDGNMGRSRQTSFMLSSSVTCFFRYSKLGHCRPAGPSRGS